MFEQGCVYTRAGCNRNELDHIYYCVFADSLFALLYHKQEGEIKAFIADQKNNAKGGAFAFKKLDHIAYSNII